MKNNSKHYDEVREYCENISLVDCHDHSRGCMPKYEDPIAVVKAGYFNSSLQTVLSGEEFKNLANAGLSLEERWPILEKGWKRAGHVGYAQVTRRVLKKFYGVEKLTLEALQGMQDKLLDLSDEKLFDSILGEANIEVRLVNVNVVLMNAIVDGAVKLSPRARMVSALDDYHRIRNYAEVETLVAPHAGMVTSLDEYIAVCREIFEKRKRFGAVAFKDASAYTRKLDYGNSTRGEAEKIFNWIMADPRRRVSYPDGLKPLDDFLFNEFMRMARDMDLPVQLHTGCMGGIRNDIRNSNAIHLTSLIERHRDVKFDLFHANWPYSGELLFLGKNYPNVSIDFCWANIIDPVYCQNLFKQALSCVPHSRIFGFGSDFQGEADRAWAHASIARDNISIALSDMIDDEYLDLDDAKEIALMWLRNNPNEFFKLGLN